MFWKRSRASDTPDEGPTKKGEPLIVALLLEADRFDLGAAEKAMTRQALGIAPTEISRSNQILSCSLAGEIVCVAPMRAPYPVADLEGPCHTSWMWPPEKPATSALTQRSHVLITMLGGPGGPLERRVLLTRLTAALCRQPGVIGIYWPEAALVHFPPVFVEMASNVSAEGPPLYLWVDFRVFLNDDGTTGLFTTGMAPLGNMEFEVPTITMPPGELREWAVNIAAYLLGRGTPIPDQDTIGVSADHQLRVRHGKSHFGTPGTVMVIG